VEANTRASLMRRLRAHTAAVHAATERLPLMTEVLSEAPTPTGYARYLTALQRVYVAIEPALYATLPPATEEALGIEPKLPALAQDVASVGIPLCVAGQHDPDIGRRIRSRLSPADLRATATALGGLYVLEGATLGGQIIARRLRSHWSGNASPPTAFLDFRARHDKGHWRRFGAALEAWAARHPGSEQAILGGALAVFEDMHAALLAPEPLEPAQVAAR
jgi:heme oxygenase